MMYSKLMQLMEGVVSTQKQHTASLQALEAKADTATRPHYQGTLQSLKELEELNDRLKMRSCFNSLVCVQCVVCSAFRNS